MNAVRKQSSADLYHVVQRGAGRQLIFEDETDRQRFLDLVVGEIRRRKGALIAWCLMGNHAHLLAHVPLDELSSAMHAADLRYARGFNKRHERSGALFQDRFYSKPIDDDAQLLATVRYIHRNPDELGADYRRYWWSSYREYVGQPETIDPRLVLGMLGSVEQFEAFHETPGAPVLTEPISKIDDETLIALAQQAIGRHPSKVKALPRAERNEALTALRATGMSIRQIERLTGVGRGIISRMDA